MVAGIHPAAAMNRDELETVLRREFPEMWGEGGGRRIEDVGYLTARVRTIYDPSQLRPGGTISGPTMMGLADLALYVAIMASVGPVTLAVTTNLAFNFLRKPSQKDLIADCRLLKLGKRLAIGEVYIRSEGEDDVVCHATGTYSIPPR